MKHLIIKSTLLLAILLVTNIVTAQNSIVGIVNYHENGQNPLSDVTVELFDDDDNFIASYITGEDGIFSFSVPSGEYYTHSTTTMDIIETEQADADIVLQYLNGNYTLNDYEYTSADVDGSGDVTDADYQLMIDKILNQGNPFDDEEWEFNDTEIDFSSRDAGDTLAVWGSSTGDVEGVWMPAGRNIDLLQEESSLVTNVNYEIIELEIGSDFDGFIRGFNLNMEYPSNLIEIVEIIGLDENLQFNLNKDLGVINVIWFDENQRAGNKFTGETLFKVKVKQLQSSTQTGDGIFTLMEGGMVLDKNSTQLDDITIKLPKVITTNNKPEFELTSYPNPVVNNLTFKITSPINNQADIYIYDLAGRLVQSKTSTGIYVGTQTISIETSSLSLGQYIYKIAIPNFNTFTGTISKTN